MKWNSKDLSEGMLVTSTTGERIGKIIRLDAETFVVEKGMLFPKDYQLRYDHVTGIERASVIYSLTDVDEPYSAVRAPDRVAADAATEVRIPLMREELDVEKFTRESGHVRIHKEIKIEERHFTVPLRREDVVIEHISAADRVGELPRGGSFEEQIVDIPLHEEDIRVGKHAVLKEEVVVRTVAQAVEQEGAATLRSEELAVEDSRIMAPAARRTNHSGADRRPEL